MLLCITPHNKQFVGKQKESTGVCIGTQCILCKLKLAVCKVLANAKRMQSGHVEELLSHCCCWLVVGSYIEPHECKFIRKVGVAIIQKSAPI